MRKRAFSSLKNKNTVNLFNIPKTVCIVYNIYTNVKKKVKNVRTAQQDLRQYPSKVHVLPFMLSIHLPQYSLPVSIQKLNYMCLSMSKDIYIYQYMYNRYQWLMTLIVKLLQIYRYMYFHNVHNVYSSIAHIYKAL